MITIEGDMFAVANSIKNTEVYIAHGVNARGLMAGGVAAVVRNRFAAAEETYKVACQVVVGQGAPLPSSLLGKIQMVDNCTDRETGNTLNIINCFTQLHPGPDAREWALTRCLDKMRRHADGVIVMPLIGGGIGGLDPDHVRDIMGLMPDHFILVEQPS